MPRRAARVLALLSVALVAGCGAGTARHVALSAPVATPAPRPLTVALATRVAAAAVLVPADLPGYAVTAQHLGASERKAEALFSRCLGHRVGPYLVRNAGREFVESGTTVDSSADVTTTRAGALAELRTLGSATGRACMEKLARVGAGAQGVEVVQLQLTPVPLAIPDSDGDVGTLLELTARYHGRLVHREVLELASVVGQTEISLSVAPGGQPLSLTEARGLLIATVARARAAL